MILTGRIQFKDVLRMLDVESIPGCDDAPHDWIDFIDCVDFDDDDIPECPECHGEGFPDLPEHTVNPWLIHDFVTAIRCGDIRTAQSLVGRVFDLPDDSACVERELFRQAA